MILALLGPPASGKGTQAKLLVEKLKVPHIALGDILREAVAKKTAVGKMAEKYLNAGHLVPDEAVIAVASERLKEKDCGGGLVLDGFPRTMMQAEALDETLKEKNQGLDRVIFLTVTLEKAIERLSGRRSCLKCGKVYHLKFNPPKTKEKCDDDSSNLYQRRDDEEETVRHRFLVYQQETAPLVEFYQKRNLLLEVDGGREWPRVFSEICQALKIES